MNKTTNLEYLSYFALPLSFLFLFCKCDEKIDTHFWLYNKDHTNIHDYEVMYFDGNEVILNENTIFDASKPTKVIAHGNGGGTHIDHTFNAAYAKAGLDYNVIGVDWRQLHGNAAFRTDLAGNHSARFLKGMVEHYGLQLTDVHAIGFSYGTHVIGILICTNYRLVLSITMACKETRHLGFLPYKMTIF